MDKPLRIIMVEHRRFAEPDPANYFQERVSIVRQKVKAYIALLMSSVFCQIVLYFLIIGANFFNLHGWSAVFARFLITFLFIGTIIIAYYLVSLLLFAYKYSKNEIDLNPKSDDDLRLKISNGEFDELYGIQLSTARSFVIGGVGTIVASGWMAFIPLLSGFLTTNELFQALILDIGSQNAEKMTEGVVTVTSVATRTNIQNLILTLDQSDYYLIIQFLPSMVVGYVSFIHIRHLLERGSSENPKMRDEIIGLIMYSRFVLSKFAGQISASQIAYTFMISVFMILGTWWHLGLMLSVFY